MLNIEKYKDVILNKSSANITCCVNGLTREGICFGDCEECKKHAMKWLLEEYKEQILDEVEKAYLSAVIKPFRNRVNYIMKKENIDNSSMEFIHIELSDEDIADFPDFKANTMYKGMKVGIHYTLQELGL